MLPGRKHLVARRAYPAQISKEQQVKLSLSKAVTGMTLTEDISVPGKGVLFARNSVISQSMLATLEQQGIHEISVSSPNEENGSDKADSSCPPEITVTISEDSMQADLGIEPIPERICELSVDDLSQALLLKGVIHGIQQKKLTEAVTRWVREKKAFTIEAAAVGAQPIPGREGGFHMTVKHLGNPADIDIARSCTFCWQLIDQTGAPIQRIRPGDVVAKRQPGSPPVPGTTVTGEPVPTSKNISAENRLEDSVSLSEDGAAAVAAIEGVAFELDGVIGIASLRFDASAELIVKPDGMQADILVHRACEGGNPPSEKAIYELIAENNIVYGIDKAEIAHLLAQLAKGEYPDAGVTIARGTPPQHGENGSVQFFFNPDTTLKPRENPDGSVNFKNVELVQAVSAGDKLARLTPPGEGTSGTDIFGRNLPCKSGTPATLPQGANTKIAADDPNTLVAGINGNVTYNGAVVEVSEGFIINGDVDFSTGNIQYEKSIVVTGDIKAGFSVNCGGDLQVAGAIEDCAVESGGSVLCKHGFVGQGKGVIEAKGDVNIGFMKNQEIRSRGNVSIAREALNCTIFARKTITISGNPLSAAGGLLFARDTISVHTVGNASGSKTILEIGTDFSLLEEMRKTEESLEEMEENSRKLKKTADRFTSQLRLRRKLPPKDEQLYAKLRKTLARYVEEIKALQQRQAIIRQKMHNFDEAYIHVEHSALTGTVFKIGERQHLLREPVVGPKTIRLLKHEIRLV